MPFTVVSPSVPVAPIDCDSHLPVLFWDVSFIQFEPYPDRIVRHKLTAQFSKMRTGTQR